MLEMVTFKSVDSYHTVGLLSSGAPITYTTHTYKLLALMAVQCVHAAVKEVTAKRRWEEVKGSPTVCCNNKKKITVINFTAKSSQTHGQPAGHVAMTGPVIPR